MIADLLASEARLLDELALTTSMLEAHRTLGQEALTALASTTAQLRRANVTILRLRDELKRYTAAAVLGRAA